MTLIEVLLAISISVLVITLVFSVYHTTSAVLGGQEERRKGPRAAMDVLYRISEDLQRGVPQWSADIGTFMLDIDDAMDEPKPSRLSYCTGVPVDERDKEWFTTQHHTLRLKREAGEVPRLERIQYPMVGPREEGTIQTNVVLFGVENFQVTVYDGSNWKSEWMAQGDKPRWPQSARIQVTMTEKAGGKTYQTEVFLPVGMVVTSDVERILQ
jgi:type II secretory pathway component PulJ